MARILIVDDDEMQRVLLRSALEGDHELLFAPDGRAALGLVRKERLDLVVTDLAMPEVNGLRLIRELREQGDTIPIIAISGAAPEQLDLAERYGAATVFFKPVDRDRLLEAVAEVLRRSRDPWSRG